MPFYKSKYQNLIEIVHIRSTYPNPIIWKIKHNIEHAVLQVKKAKKAQPLDFTWSNRHGENLLNLNKSYSIKSQK